MWFRGVRLLMTFILSLLTTPLATHAQQATTVHRIGRLLSGSSSSDRHLVEAFAAPCRMTRISGSSRCYALRRTSFIGKVSIRKKCLLKGFQPSLRNSSATKA